MVLIHLRPDDAANVRFGFSSVWETTASLYSVRDPAGTYLHRPLRDQIRRAGGRLEDLLELTALDRWIPDVLAPQPSSRGEDPEAELWSIREADPSIAESDLDVLRSVAPRSRWAQMSPDQYLESVSEALLSYWRDELAARWEVIVYTNEADVAGRLPGMAASGVGTTLRELSSAIEYDDGTLKVRTKEDCRLDGAGGGVWLVPSVFRWPKVGVATIGGQHVVISYPAIGFASIWEPDDRDKRGVGELIGRSRAAVLAELRVPRSTTALAKMLDLAPATVSKHLSTLAATGLVRSRREGRVVLYSRTVLGDSLLSAGERSRQLA